jgi:hypothetical protein
MARYPRWLQGHDLNGLSSVDGRYWPTRFAHDIFSLFERELNGCFQQKIVAVDGEIVERVRRDQTVCDNARRRRRARATARTGRNEVDE